MAGVSSVGKEIIVTGMSATQFDTGAKEYFHPGSGMVNGDWKTANGGAAIQKNIQEFYKAVFGVSTMEIGFTGKRGMIILLDFERKMRLSPFWVEHLGGRVRRRLFTQEQLNQSGEGSPTPNFYQAPVEYETPAEYLLILRTR